jgi:hypothetical protein
MEREALGEIRNELIDRRLRARGRRAPRRAGVGGIRDIELHIRVWPHGGA